MKLFSTIAGMFRRDQTDAVVRTMTATMQQFLAGADLDGGASKLNSPYKHSPWVQRAIKTIAGPIMAVEMEYFESTRGGDVEIEDEVLKAFWAAPAQGQGTNRMRLADAMEATVGWLCLRGEFFWVLDDTWLTRSKFKSPLLIARPDRMMPVKADGELVGWRYRDASGKSVDLIAEQVVSSGFWNPDDDCRGCAPWESARQAAESDYAAGAFWKTLAESNGDRGMTVIAPNGITPEQQEQVVRALRAKRQNSRDGKLNPLFLVGDLKTEDPRIQSPDVAAVTQRLQSRQEIALAFGVPPSFFEVTASYSVGSASDRYKLIEETCMPIARKISDAAETVSAMLRGGKRTIVRFDFDEHSTMQQVRAERIEAGRKLHERGVPWSVISDYLGLGIKPFPGWDQAWLPFTLTSVGGLPEDDPAPVPAPERPTDSMAAITELEELLKGCPCHSQKPSRQANAGTAKRTAAAQKWEGYMKTRAPFVRRCRSGIDRALYVARKECLKKIAEAAASDSSDEGKAVRAPNGAFDYIFDLGTFETAMVTTVTSTSAAACQAGAEELLDTELPDAEVTFTADQAGLDALRARGNYIKDASNDIWTSVRDSLDEGIQAGESYAKLADRVRGEFNELSRTQSMRIAVTETSIAFETGRAGAMKAAGVQWKEWITAGDERVRASHVAMDGKTIPMDEPFQVGGASLMYPCDPSGPPGEVINCRCIHGPAQAPPGAPDPADIEGNNPDAGIPF